MQRALTLDPNSAEASTGLALTLANLVLKTVVLYPDRVRGIALAPATAADCGTRFSEVWEASF